MPESSIEKSYRIIVRSLQTSEIEQLQTEKLKTYYYMNESCECVTLASFPV